MTIFLKLKKLNAFCADFYKSKSVFHQILFKKISFATLILTFIEINSIVIIRQ